MFAIVGTVLILGYDVLATPLDQLRPTYRPGRNYRLYETDGAESGYGLMQHRNRHIASSNLREMTVADVIRHYQNEGPRVTRDQTHLNPHPHFAAVPGERMINFAASRGPMEDAIHREEWYHHNGKPHGNNRLNFVSGPMEDIIHEHEWGGHHD